METDPFVELKAKAREGWSGFAPVEVMTAQSAAHLVRFAGIQPGQVVLDVGTGTGVVAVTASRVGARVTGLDMTPALLERARHNAAVAELTIEWCEGDAEALPFGDSTFDVVVSQFGHMFAPRAEVVTRELLRVLKPGGTIAFATWPPEHFVGRLFALGARYMPPPPGVTPPPTWGVPGVVSERLGAAVEELRFERGLMAFVALSPKHYRAQAETFGPFATFAKANANDPETLSAFRNDVEALAAEYFVDNAVRQDYLLSRATKRS